MADRSRGRFLGFGDIEGFYSRLAVYGMDNKPFLRTAAKIAKGHVVRDFNRGVSPDSSPFAPLAESTIKGRRKGKRRKDPKPLLDTGGMLKSIRDNSVYELSDKDVTFGTNHPVAAVHQHGTTKAGKKNNVTIPARTFMGISVVAEREIHGAYLLHRSRYLAKGNV